MTKDVLEYVPTEPDRVKYIIWDIGGPFYSRHDHESDELNAAVDQEFLEKIVSEKKKMKLIDIDEDTAREEFYKIKGQTHSARKALEELAGGDYFDECMDKVDPREYLIKDDKLYNLIVQLKNEYGIESIILTNGSELFKKRAVEAVLGADVESLLADGVIHSFYSSQDFPGIKPDPVVFEYVMQQTNKKAAPINFLSIGDEVVKDILPPKKLGMQVFYFDRQLRKAHEFYELCSQYWLKKTA
ncbi:MAG: HAD family hydrolase [Nanoarchaeota archaeon]|nr:HAD family hydrolase [Nanoarchaeota archaeon]